MWIELGWILLINESQNTMVMWTIRFCRWVNQILFPPDDLFFPIYNRKSVLPWITNFLMGNHIFNRANAEALLIICSMFEAQNTYFGIKTWLSIKMAAVTVPRNLYYSLCYDVFHVSAPLFWLLVEGWGNIRDQCHSWLWILWSSWSEVLMWVKVWRIKHSFLHVLLVCSSRIKPRNCIQQPVCAWLKCFRCLY